jgi:DnaJ family protein C protein 2
LLVNAACRLAAEEAAKAAAAEAKKQREADKKLLKRERQRLRQLAEAATSSTGGRLVDEDSVEKLCQTLGYSQLQELNDSAAATGGEASKVAEVLQGALQQIQQREEEEAAAKERQKKEAAAALKVSRDEWMAPVHMGVTNDTRQA